MLLLNDQRCDVNIANDYRCTPLMYAIGQASTRNDHTCKIIEAILSREQCDITSRDAEGRTSLLWIVWLSLKSAAGFELLISDARCDVNAEDNDGFTPLSVLVTKVQSLKDPWAEMIRLLLNHPHIDVNKQNRKGDSALHEARGGNAASHVGAQLLIDDARCDVNLPDNNGHTPLMMHLQQSCVNY